MKKGKNSRALEPNLSSPPRLFPSFRPGQPTTVSARMRAHLAAAWGPLPSLSSRARWCLSRLMTCGTANPMTQRITLSRTSGPCVSAPSSHRTVKKTPPWPQQLLSGSSGSSWLASVSRAHKSRSQPLSPLLLNFACAASVEVSSPSKEHPGSVAVARMAVGGTPVPSPSSSCCGIRELRLNPLFAFAVVPVRENGPNASNLPRRRSVMVVWPPPWIGTYTPIQPTGTSLGASLCHDEGGRGGFGGRQWSERVELLTGVRSPPRDTPTSWAVTLQPPSWEHLEGGE
jgi:hypothetical protein